MTFGPGDNGHIAEHNSVRATLTSQGVELANMDTATANRVVDDGTATGAALASNFAAVFGVTPGSDPATAYAALVANGGGELRFLPGVHTISAMTFSTAIPLRVTGLGATIKPASNSMTIFTFSGTSATDPRKIIEDVFLECTGSTGVTGIKIVDNFGLSLSHVKVHNPSVGILITDVLKWSEGTAMDQVFIHGATSAGIELKKDTGTGSFGYFTWGTVQIDAVPNGAVGFKVGAGAQIANSFAGQIVIHGGADGCTGVSIAGDVFRNADLNFTIEYIPAGTPTTATALSIASTALMDGGEIAVWFIGPWTTEVSNTSNIPYRIQTPYGWHRGNAITDISEQSGIPGDTQPRFYRTVDGTLSWGPGGGVGRDAWMYRSGVGSVTIAGSLSTTAGILLNAGSAAPRFYSGLRLTSSADTSSFTLSAAGWSNRQVDATSGNITVTLFTGSTPGYFYVISKIDATANTVTIARPSGGTINGVAANITLTTIADTALVFSVPGTNAWMVKVI